MSLEGQQFGEFEILERLGQGGMGAVYKARQTSLDRFVALKTLQVGLSEDAAYIARFQQEARAAARLNHPNLVQVHSAGVHEGVYWFAMEYVAGESARVRLQREERLEAREALAIALHVATALEYGWRKEGLIHRDIKPDNIFLSNDGEVKLGDLGLAKSAGQTAGLTTAGHSMGTPYYISPEQVQDMKEVDLRADIYSLGCTLFHLLSGHPPFVGSSGSTIMLKHITMPVPNLHDAWPECPPVLGEVVHKMMEKEPEARQQDHAEVIRDLQRAYDAVSAGQTDVVGVKLAEEASGGEVGDPEEAALTMEEVPKAGGKPVVRAVPRVVATPARSKVPLYVGAAAAVLVVGIAGVFFTRPGSKPGAVNPPGDVARVATTEKVSTPPVIAESDLPKPAAVTPLPESPVDRPLASSPVRPSLTPAPLEPGAVRLWDTPEKVTARSGVAWKEGVLTVHNNFAYVEGLTSRDGIIRAMVRSDDPGLGVGVRLRQSYKSAASAVCANYQPSHRTFQVAVGVGDHYEQIDSWAAPRKYGVGEWFQLELRVVGDAITVSVDGQVLGTAHSSLKLEAGHPAVDGVGSFRDVVYVPLDGSAGNLAGNSTSNSGVKSLGNSGANSPARPPATPIPPGPGAMRLWDTAAKIPKAGGATFENGTLKLVKAHVLLSERVDHDGVIRAAVCLTEGDGALGITLHQVDGALQSAWMLHYESKYQRVTLKAKVDGNITAATVWPAPRSYAPGEWFTLELREVGDLLTAAIDGQVLGQVHSTLLMAPGSPGVYVAEGTAVFRDIVYEPLDGVAGHSGANLASSPMTSPAMTIPAAQMPGAMRLWDTVAKSGFGGGVSVENGVLKMVNAHKTLTEVPSRDGILQAMVNVVEGMGGMGISLRYTEGAHTSGAVQFNYDPRRQRFYLNVLNQIPATLLGNWPAPRNYAPGEWFQMELRVVGDSFTASVDGQVLGTAQSSLSAPKGDPNVFSSNTVQFRDIIYVPLDNPPAAAATPAPPLEPGAIRAWASADTIGANPHVAWKEDALWLDGASLTLDTPALRNAAIRATVRMNPDAERVHFGLRNKDKSNYFLNVRAQDSTVELRKCINGNYNSQPLGTWRLARTYRPEEYARFELKAIDDQLTVSAEGQVLGTVRDISVSGAGGILVYAEARGYFRDIVYVPLEGTPAAVAVEPSLPLETGAIRVWDSPASYPKYGHTVEDRAHRLDGNGSDLGDVTMRNGIVRASIRMNPDVMNPHLGLRNRNNNCYFIQVHPDKSTVELRKEINGNYGLPVVQTWYLPRPYRPEEYARFELKVVDDQLTVSADGQVLGSVHDTSIAEPGGLMVYAAAKGYFRDVVYAPLDGLPVGATTPAAGSLPARTPVPAPAPPALEPRAVRLWDTAVKAPQSAKVTFENGVITLNQANFRAYDMAGRDGAIRATVRVNSAPGGIGLSMRIASSGPNRMNLDYQVNRKLLSLVVYSGGQVVTLGKWPAPRPYEIGDWFQLELRAVGDTITVSADGQVLGTVKNSLLMETGYPGIYEDGSGSFRDIVYVPLDTLGANSAGKPVAAAAFTPPPLEPGGLRLWDTIGKVPRGDGVSFANGMLTLHQIGISGLVSPSRDCRIRASINPSTEKASSGVMLRWREHKGINGWQAAYDAAYQKFTLGYAIEGQYTRVTDWPAPRAYASGEWFQLELRASGDTLTVLVDGEVIGSTRSSVLPESGTARVFSNGTASFRDIVYVPHN